MSIDECIPIQGGVTHRAFKGVLEFLYTDEVHEVGDIAEMLEYMSAVSSVIVVEVALRIRIGMYRNDRKLSQNFRENFYVVDHIDFHIS